MNLKEIRELIDMVRGTGISEIELEREGSRVRIRMDQSRRGDSGEAAVRVRAVPEGWTESAGVHAADVSPPGGAEEWAGQIVVTSPMVGTFYRSPAPDASPFVEVGSVVEKGQPLCIIEAMKLMNEIEAESRGRILKILKNDKDPVEYGEPLFVLEPVT